MKEYIIEDPENIQRERCDVFVYWGCIIALLFSFSLMVESAITCRYICFIIAYTEVAASLWCFFEVRDDYLKVMGVRICRKFAIG